jgi:hypothetical protein
LIAIAVAQAALATVCFAQAVYPVTDNMKAILKKNAAFGLKKYPISIWNYTDLKADGEHMTEAEMQSLADAGITVPQSPNFDPADPAQKAHILKMLDWAAARDMKLILRDPRCMGQAGADGKPPADYATGVKAAVADFGKHPALFGFFVGDEGGGDAFAECQRIQKEIAPHLFPFYNHLPAMGPGWDKVLDKYMQLSNSDILGYDCYMQMHNKDGQRGIDAYFESLRIYREASLRHGVPFWNTALSLGHMMYRSPSLTDLQWQLNTSVAAGANAMVWFFWYLPHPCSNTGIAPIDEFWEKTQTYNDMRRVQQRFHKTYGDLFNRLVSTRVSFYPKACGQGEVFTPDDLVLGIWPAYDGDCPILIGEFTDKEGRRYVMFVNNSQTQTDRVLAKFPLKSKLYSFSHGCEGKEILVNDGSKPDPEFLPEWLWLRPGGEMVFRVELAK